MRALLFCTTALLATLLMPAGASAVITGAITDTRFSGEVHVAGPGFQLDARLANGFFPGGCATNTPVCPAGTLMGLSTFSSDGDVVGFVTANGVTFELGQATSPAAAFIQTTGSVLLPPLEAAATVTAPFTFSIRAVTRAQQTLGEFTGDGLASVELHGVLTPPGGWELTRVTFPINPVPEPSTALLVGVGVAAARAGTRWRRPTRSLPGTREGEAPSV